MTSSRAADGRPLRRVLVPIVATALALLPGFALTASALVVIEHAGANDPVSQGWGASGFTNVAVGPVVNDLGSGFDAWKVDDNGTAIGDAGFYTFVPGPAQLTQAATWGWKLSTRLRVVEAPDPVGGAPSILFDGSPFVSYRDGARSWQLHFGAQADGDPIVHLATAFAPNPAGTTIVLDGAGPGYHLYELVYDPVTQTADLLVDGAVVHTGYPGAPLTQTFVLFGAGSSCCLGWGNFNLVRLDIRADHFLCYQARRAKNTPAFAPRTVTLADQFNEPAVVTVRRPLSLCNPAEKTFAGTTDQVLDPRTHLGGYKITGGAHAPRTLVMDNQLGAVTVTTKKRDRLLVPTAKSLTLPSPDAPDPAAHAVDHFACYTLKVVPFDALQVHLVDQFGEPKLFDVRRPTHVCNPANKNGEDIESPTLHLTCYQIRPAAGEPKHVKVPRLFVNNQFGPGELATVKPEHLCVPSAKAEIP